MRRSWKANFLLVAAGQMFSLVGSSAVQFALIWWIASETGSAAMMGLSSIAAFLPMALLSPLAGVAADRYSRKRVCIAADLAMGAAAAAFALLMWLWEAPTWLALAVLLLRGVGDTFHQPAFQAMIPQLVPASELTRAGGWSQIGSSVSRMAGPAVGAALYAALPLPLVLLTDLLGALVASAMLALARVPRQCGAAREGRRHLWRELREGVQVFREDAFLLLMTAVETLAMLFILPMSSFMPLMTSNYFRASAWHASAVEVCYALGLMLSGLAFGGGMKSRRPLWLSYFGLLGVGLAAALCGALPPAMGAWAAFAAGIGIIGACCNVHNVPLMAYMQSSVRQDRQGRAFALSALLSAISTPVGLAIGAPFADRIGVNRWFLLAGSCVCLLALLGMLGQRALERREEKPPRAQS